MKNRTKIIFNNIIRKRGLVITAMQENCILNGLHLKLSSLLKNFTVEYIRPLRVKFQRDKVEHHSIISALLLSNFNGKHIGLVTQAAMFYLCMK